jgi:3-oxoadipate enol-lactonase
MPFADIGGYSMHYRLDDFTEPWTEPETILLQHGWCRNSRFWYAWVPMLARKYRVLRPELRGCGQSPTPSPDQDPSAELFASDLLRLLDALELKRVHYVGESFGGFTGLQFAWEHPERVMSLSLVNTFCRLEDPWRGHVAAGFRDFAEAMDALGLEEWCRRTVSIRLDQDRASPQLSEWLCKEIGKVDLTWAKKWMAYRPDFVSRLPELRVPVLLLAAGKSRITNLDQQRMMAERIPNAELSIIENVGHSVGFLEPEKCAEAVLRFIDRVSR